MFWFDSKYMHTEGAAPWALNSNIGDYHKPYGPVGAVGRHNVTARALSSSGAILGTSTVVYTVTTASSPLPAPVASQPFSAPNPQPVFVPTPTTNPVFVPSPVAAPITAPVAVPVPVPVRAPIASPVIVPPPVQPRLAPVSSSTVSMVGELRKWHKVTIVFAGPLASETGTPNPFLDYRLDVTFVHSSTGKQYKVPGYFAADGNAAETSATSGNVWQCHFSPDEIGVWTFTASFVTGSNVAVATTGGTPTSFHGQTGTFTVAASNKVGRDLRSKGRLQYVGQHHLKFADGEWFLKAGLDR
jgi:Domain of unknown function (DUF5060)